MPYRSFGEPELTRLREVIESGDLWRGLEGRFVGEFEDRFSEHTGRKFVHAVASGTAANEAALFGVGVGPGDEVIVPPCSFIASSMSVVVLGAVPVFADVDPRTMGLTAEGLEAALTPRAKAVVVVHLWGQPAEMDPILEVARRHNLKVVEDCAQAYDAYYHGRMVGTLGDVACYSLQQSKHITSGEGGMITTDDPEVYCRAVLYANCGMPWYRYRLEKPTAEPVGPLATRGHFACGHNYRMSELQGAVACAQLDKLPEFTAR
ncbi:MAG: DegT/DnrJ/EryC1/StrS family aminotransferase, partial [Armatimonadetes bacterium]|nr:DegT/DnrJ/EryC1/StrS family aminotransferase [Armatimonadota bacterium]